MAGGAMMPNPLLHLLANSSDSDINQSDLIRMFSPPLLLGLSQPSYVQHTDSKGNLKPPQLNYDWVPPRLYLSRLTTSRYNFTRWDCLSKCRYIFRFNNGWPNW